MCSLLMFRLISMDYTPVLKIRLPSIKLKFHKYKDKLLMIQVKIKQSLLRTTYVPFMPNKDEQDSPLLFYRNCWHRYLLRLFI
jgi:hypothetical protein